MCTGRQSKLGNSARMYPRFEGGVGALCGKFVAGSIRQHSWAVCQVYNSWIKLMVLLYYSYAIL